MATGVGQMLLDIEDLSLKAFIASRCASRQLQLESAKASRLAEVKAFTSSRAEAKKAAEDLELSR